MSAKPPPSAIRLVLLPTTHPPRMSLFPLCKCIIPELESMLHTSSLQLTMFLFPRNTFYISGMLPKHLPVPVYFFLCCFLSLGKDTSLVFCQPVNPKGNQPWIFIGRTDAEAEVPDLWLPEVKSRLIGKDLNTGKDRGQEEKGMAEDEMIGWHHLPQWTWIWASFRRSW